MKTIKEFNFGIQTCACLDTSGVAKAPPDKHTPEKLNLSIFDQNGKNKTLTQLKLDIKSKKIQNTLPQTNGI